MRLFYLLTACFLVGCSVPVDESSRLIFLEAQSPEKNWQDRETAEMATDPIYQQDGIIDLQLAAEISRQAYVDIDYYEEKPDLTYYQTSGETMRSGRGVCSDISIYVYMQLRAAGFPDSRIGVLFLQHPEKTNGHCWPAIWEPDGSFRILSADGVHAVGDIPGGWYPVAGFNLFEEWGQ